MEPLDIQTEYTPETEEIEDEITDTGELNEVELETLTETVTPRRPMIESTAYPLPEGTEEMRAKMIDY